MYQRVLAAVVGVVLAAVGATGVASAAEQSKDFRVAWVDQRPGVTSFTVVAPPALGEDPPPPDRIEVIEAASGSPVDAQVQRLPRAPLEVVIVADASGGPQTIEAIQGALGEFILALPEGSAVAIVAAGDEPHLIASLTRSTDEALAGLALLAPTDPGLPEAAIGLGLDQLTGTAGTRPVVVEVRTGSYRSATVAGSALDATRDRLEEQGVDVYAVRLGTALLGEHRLPVDSRAGFSVQAPGLPNLLGALDTIAVDLSLARYRVDIFGLDEATGVLVRSDWRSVHSEAVSIAGPPGTARPLDRPDPSGPPLGKLAAAAAGVALVAAVVLLPPARRRRRAARAAALPAVPVGLRLERAAPVPPPSASPTTESALGGEDVEGTAAVCALLAERSRPAAEVWLGDDVDPAVRAEIEALAEARRVPVRAGVRPGAAVPVAARAAPLVPEDLGALWSRAPRPVVLAVAGAPSPAELGSILRAAGTQDDAGGTALAGVVLPRQPSSRVTAATAATAAGAIERLALALVPDLGAALAAARDAGVRVVGVVGGTAAADTAALAPADPTLVVLPATAELERSLRARCDAVVALGGTGAADRVERLVEMLAAARAEAAEVDLPDAVHARSSR